MLCATVCLVFPCWFLKKPAFCGSVGDICRMHVLQSAVALNASVF